MYRIKFFIQTQSYLFFGLGLGPYQTQNPTKPKRNRLFIVNCQYLSRQIFVKRQIILSIINAERF